MKLRQERPPVRIHMLARRESRDGFIEIRGYWPETNKGPLFLIGGNDWLTEADLAWIAEQAQAVELEPLPEGSDDG